MHAWKKRIRRGNGEPVRIYHSNILLWGYARGNITWQNIFLLVPLRSIPYPKAAISPRSTSLGQGIWTNFGPQCPRSCCNSCFQTFGAKETAARPGTVPWAPARLNPGYRPLAPFLRFTRFAYRWSLMVALLLLASSAERGS